MTIDDLLREAEEQQRRELEKMALEVIELRARLPQLVEEAVRRDRERIAVELAERSGLSYREIGKIVDQSDAWVFRAVAETDR